MNAPTRGTLTAQWTEVQVSACALLGALFLVESGAVLLDAEPVWKALAAPIFLGATMAASAAVLPWVWPACPFGPRRAAMWAGWLVATGAAIVALLPLEFNALLGSQLVLMAAVLSEMNGRPATLRWMWFSAGLIAAIVWIYYTTVPLRMVAD